MRRLRPAFAMALAAVLALGLLNALGALFRPFWMDEAITAMDFASRPTLLKVYLAYNIPNNHILFTMALKLWLDACDWLGIALNWTMRIPSLAFGLLALAFAFMAAARRGGLLAGSVLIAFFALSPAFAIYASAERGYMLGMAFAAAALLLSGPLLRRGGFWRSALHFALCFGAAGTIPTNALALEATALFQASRAVRDFKKIKWRLAWLLLAPPLALAAFYLPILGKFIHCMTLGEGWSGHLRAAGNLYGAFALAFAPLLPLCLWGAVRLWRKGGLERKASLLALFAALALPLPFLLFAPTPPFPRVFLPLWALWLALLAEPLRESFRAVAERFPKLKAGLAAGLLLCAWLAVETQGKAQLRDALFGDGMRDDLFYPRYMEPGFRPDAVAEKFAALLKENPDAKAFVSFEADHFATLMHGNMRGIPNEAWLCDAPGRPLRSLPEKGSLLLVCAGRADLDSTLSRFGLTGAELLYDFGVQQLYKAERRPASP